MSRTNPNENILTILDNELSNLLNTWEEFITLQKFDQPLPPTFKKKFLTDFETFYTNIAGETRLYPDGKLKVWPFEQLKNYISLFLDFFEYSERILLLFEEISNLQPKLAWKSLLQWEDSLIFKIQQECISLGKKLTQIDKPFVKFFYNQLYTTYISAQPNNKFSQLLDRLTMLGQNLSSWGEVLAMLPSKLVNDNDYSNKLHNIIDSLNTTTDFFTHDLQVIKNFFHNLYELAIFSPSILKCQSNHEQILKDVVNKGLFGDKLFEDELQKQIHEWDEFLINVRKANNSDLFKKYDITGIDQWVLNQQYLKDLFNQHQQFREKLEETYWIKTKDFKLTQCIRPTLQFVEILHTQPKDKLPKNLQQIIDKWSKLHLNFIEWFQLSNQNMQTFQFLGNWISSTIQLSWDPVLAQELEQLSKSALKLLCAKSLTLFVISFLKDYGHDFLPLVAHFQEKYTFITPALQDIDNWGLIKVDENVEKKVKDIIDAMVIFFTRSGWQEAVYIFSKLKQVYENEFIILIKELKVGFPLWTKFSESRWENANRSKDFLNKTRESCLKIKSLLSIIYSEDHSILSSFENQLKKINYLGIIVENFDQPFIHLLSRLNSGWNAELQKSANVLEEQIIQIKKILEINILGKEKYLIITGEYILLWMNIFNQLVKFFSLDFVAISTQQDTIITMMQSWDTLYQKKQIYNEYIPKSVFEEYQKFVQQLETLKEPITAFLNIQSSYSNMLNEYPQINLESRKKYIIDTWKALNIEFNKFKDITHYFTSLERFVKKYEIFLGETRQTIECSYSIEIDLTDAIQISKPAIENQQKANKKAILLLKKDLDSFFGLPDPKTTLGKNLGSKLQEKYQDLYSLLESNKDLPTIQQLKNVKEK